MGVRASLAIGVLLVGMVGLFTGCERQNPASSYTANPLMPVLQSNVDPGKGFGVYMTYQHTQPGVYSEIRVTVYGEPPDKVKLTLSGPAVTPPAEQTLSVEADGSVTFIWKITQFGTYTVQGTYAAGMSNSQSIKDTVVVTSANP